MKNLKSFVFLFVLLASLTLPVIVEAKVVAVGKLKPVTPPITPVSKPNRYIGPPVVIR